MSRFHFREIRVISIIVSGLIVGALAKLVMPGKDGSGLFSTALLGIAGAFVGTVIGRFVFHIHSNLPGHYAAGWIMSFLGALAVLAVYHLVTRPCHYPNLLSLGARLRPATKSLSFVIPRSRVSQPGMPSALRFM